MRLATLLFVACAPPDLIEVEVTEVPLSCDDPSARARLGRYETIELATEPVSWTWTWGGGVTVADLDGDGALDIVQPVESAVEVRWGPAAWAAEVERIDLSYASGVTAADFDGDGDLDLYVMRVLGFPVPDDATGSLGDNVLLRNDGERRFTDVTAETGVDGCGPHHRDGESRCYRTMTSSWGDVDGDGDLDLFVGNYGFVDDTPGTRQADMEPGEPSFLYLSAGDGTFERTALPDAVSDGYTFAGGLLDLDADGDLDLYVVNDFGVVSPNQALFNEGGVLVPEEPDGPSGLVQRMTGMGLGVGDLNGDGRPDLVVPNWQYHTLLESRASEGWWLDTASARGLVPNRRRNQLVGWGTTLGDLDDDVDLDVIAQFGYVRNDNPVWTNPLAQGDAVYLNDGAAAFALTDVALDWGLASSGAGRGAVLADLNRDGWLDIVKRELQGRTLVHLSRCGAERGGLLVRLRQPGPNPSAIGARMVAEVGDRVVQRDVSAGGRGFASAEPLELHLGLGTQARVRRLTVTWPDGARSVVHRLPANHAVTLVRDR